VATDTEYGTRIVVIVIATTMFMVLSLERCTNPLFLDFKLSMLVSPDRLSAASLCLSATVLLLNWSTVAETAHFEGGTQI